jgi:hypothetical protein
MLIAKGDSSFSLTDILISGQIRILVASHVSLGVVVHPDQAGLVE